MSSQAMILFAHGARDPAWASPMQRLQAMMRCQAPNLRVELAFLEFMAPDLPACAEQLLAEGIDDLLILPLFIATGGHLKKDLPELVQGLRERYPAVRFTLAGAVGEEESILAAMAAHALALAHAQ